MKKTLCALLAMLLLLTAVSLAEETPNADSLEGSRLVGLLITREDLSASTGDAGAIFAMRTQTEPDGETQYTFADVSGLRLICFIAPEEGGEESSVISNVDEGISAADFDLGEDGSSMRMSAAISVVPSLEDEFFFFNPVLLTASGRVLAVPGDSMAVSAAMNPPGSAVGQTYRDERKHTENGREISDTTIVDIQIKAVRKPLMIRLLQFSRTHELLQAEEFLPGAVPEEITPLAAAAYLLLETEEEDPFGGAFTRREVFGRDADDLYTLSCRDDGICLSHYHEIYWNTDGTPGE